MILNSSCNTKVVHEEFLLGKSIQGSRVYLYPHLHFSIGFNNDQIVSANVTTDAKRRVDITDLTTGQEVVFSYTVDWVHMPELKYGHRMKRYADSTFLPNTFEIHWLSIINSIVLVLLLTAFLAVILTRILKKDFSKYMEIDEVRRWVVFIIFLFCSLFNFCYIQHHVHSMPFYIYYYH